MKASPATDKLRSKLSCYTSSNKLPQIKKRPNPSPSPSKDKSQSSLFICIGLLDMDLQGRTRSSRLKNDAFRNTDNSKVDTQLTQDFIQEDKDKEKLKPISGMLLSQLNTHKSFTLLSRKPEEKTRTRMSEYDYQGLKIAKRNKSPTPSRPDSRLFLLQDLVNPVQKEQKEKPKPKLHRRQYTVSIKDIKQNVTMNAQPIKPISSSELHEVFKKYKERIEQQPKITQEDEEEKQEKQIVEEEEYTSMFESPKSKSGKQLLV